MSPTLPLRTPLACGAYVNYDNRLYNHHIEASSVLWRRVLVCGKNGFGNDSRDCFQKWRIFGDREYLRFP